MKSNLHAGHTKSGIGSGAVGFINESKEARKLKNLVKKKLRAKGHTVYDCTNDKASSVNDNLYQIVRKCNAHSVDYDISIHFNAGAYDQSGNRYTTGTEVYIYSQSSEAKKVAQRVVDAIAATGFANRGVKVNPSLYVLKHTQNLAMLIEVCFVDDKDDFKAYNRRKVANAIVKALVA
ncbi:MAG: N-acetylmuramoyl-L-alanine amidase [Lachnospiraceae bacterium]